MEILETFILGIGKGPKMKFLKNFKIHLATLFIIQILIIFFLWLNFRSRLGTPNLALDMPVGQSPEIFDFYGWPFGVDVYFDVDSGRRRVVLFKNRNKKTIPLNILICLSLIIFLSFFCEILIKKCEKCGRVM